MQYIGGGGAWVCTDAGLRWSSMVPGTNLSGAVICGRWGLLRELRWLRSVRPQGNRWLIHVWDKSKSPDKKRQEFEYLTACRITNEQQIFQNQGWEQNRLNELWTMASKCYAPSLHVVTGSDSSPICRCSKEKIQESNERKRHHRKAREKCFKHRLLQPGTGDIY